MECVGYLVGFVAIGAVLFYGFRNSPKKHNQEDDGQWGEALANDELVDSQPSDYYPDEH